MIGCGHLGKERLFIFLIKQKVMGILMKFQIICRSIVWRKLGQLCGGTTQRQPSAMRKLSNRSTRTFTRAQVLSANTLFRLIH